MGLEIYLISKEETSSGQNKRFPAQQGLVLLDRSWTGLDRFGLDQLGTLCRMQHILDPKFTSVHNFIMMLHVFWGADKHVKRIENKKSKSLPDFVGKQSQIISKTVFPIISLWALALLTLQAHIRGRMHKLFG